MAAAVAGLALTHTIGTAAVKGLVTRSEPFFRTPKRGNSSGLLRALAAAREETVMVVGLLLSAWGVAYTGTRETAGPDRLAWIVVLLIQSVPYASSLIVSLISAFPLPARWLGTSYRPVARIGPEAQAGPGGLRPVRERRLQAIATMIAAVAVFSFMDAVLKFFAMRYPPMEVAALRGAASLPFTLAPVLIAGRLRDLVPRRWPMHVLRGCLSVVVIGGFVYAVRSLSLANAYSVFLSAPLLVAALSVPLLRERLGWRNWLAILVGLAGVLVMLRPTTSGLASLGAAGRPHRRHRLRPERNRGAGPHPHRHHGERRFLDHQPHDRIRHRRGRPGLGCDPAGALEMAAGARGACRDRPVPAHRGVSLGTPLGGLAVRVHRAPLGSRHRPRGMAGVALGAGVPGRRHRDRERALPHLARAQRTAAPAAAGVMAVTAAARQNASLILDSASARRQRAGAALIERR